MSQRDLKFRNTLIAISLAVNILFYCNTAFAGSTAVGQIFMRVLANLNIEQVAPMVFPSAFAGAASETISLDGDNGARFVVSGQPNTSFQINIPDEVILQTGSADEENQKIKVYNFMSYPAQKGIIDSEGKQTIKLGATRDALLPDQADGEYSGTYTIEIIY